MFYEPKKGSPFKIDPFKSLVFPRPIGWISSISKNGIANLAPYSYFNAVADEPPQVMFCSSGSSSHGKYKDAILTVTVQKNIWLSFSLCALWRHNLHAQAVSGDDSCWRPRGLWHGEYPTFQR